MVPLRYKSYCLNYKSDKLIAQWILLPAKQLPIIRAHREGEGLAVGTIKSGSARDAALLYGWLRNGE